MNQSQIKASLEESVVLVKNGITYLPHYRNSSIFVGPGYGQLNSTHYLENQLLAQGAAKEKRFLLTRGKNGAVSEVKP